MMYTCSYYYCHYYSARLLCRSVCLPHTTVQKHIYTRFAAAVYVDFKGKIYMLVF